MDDNFLFRWIWRFNALGLAAFLIIVGASALPYLFFWRYAGNQTIIYGEPGPAALEQSQLRLSMHDVIDGTGAILFAYGNSYDLPRGGSFSKPPQAVNLNFLFYDTKNNSSRWLFPTNGQEITSVDYAREDGAADEAAHMIGPDGLPLPRASREVPSPQQGTRKVRAVLFDVRPLAKEGAKSAYQMYATHPDGSGLTRLLDALDEPGTFASVDPGTIVIASKREGRTYATTVSLTDFKTTAEVELTKDMPK